MAAMDYINQNTFTGYLVAQCTKLLKELFNTIGMQLNLLKQLP